MKHRSEVTWTKQAFFEMNTFFRSRKENGRHGMAMADFVPIGIFWEQTYVWLWIWYFARYLSWMEFIVQTFGPSNLFLWQETSLLIYKIFIIGLTLQYIWPYLWNTTIYIHICANTIRMAQRWTTMRMRWKVSRVQL